MTSLPLLHLRLQPPLARRRTPPASKNLRPPAASVGTRVDPKPAAPERSGIRSSGPPPAAPSPKLLDDSEVEPRGVMDFIEQSRDLVRPDGGPPRWFSPVECGPASVPRAVESPPPLFYLPGMFVVSPSFRFHALSLCFILHFSPFAF